MNCTEISIFGYENKNNIQSMCQKNTFKKYAGFLSIKEKSKKYCFLFKYFNEFAYLLLYITSWKKNFLSLLFTSVSYKRNIALKLTMNKGLRCLRRVNVLNSKITKGK